MDGAGQAMARYTHGPAIDWPLLMEREGQTFFYHADALGSVAALADSSGNVVRSYAYDSWGRPQGTEASGPANPFLFAGREYDVETGLYYLRARYYDPVVGRFISSDPLDIAGLLLTSQDPAAGFALLPASASILASDSGSAPLRAPQQLNPYSYALNNPVALRDPSGLEPCKPKEPTAWERFWEWEFEFADEFNDQLEYQKQQLKNWWEDFQLAYKENSKKDWAAMGPSEYYREIVLFLKSAGTAGSPRIDPAVFKQ
jgi:RHS repeat-associated protein